MTPRKFQAVGHPSRLIATSAVCILLSAGGSACLSAANASDITYYVSQTIGAGTVTGDIVTDGTIGFLVSNPLVSPPVSDFVDWHLKLSEGASTVDLHGPLSGSNSEAFVLPFSTFAIPNLSATATQLLFNFSAPVSPAGANDVVFQNNATPTNGYWAFCNASCVSSQPPPPPGTGGEALSTIANSNFTFSYVSGTQAIGSTAILPVSVTRLGAFEYDIPVAAGQTYFVDPKVAIGYSFSTGAGEPNFASVLLPAVQSDPFDVSFTYNGVAHTDMVAPLTVFDFPTGGVSAFKVTGIDPADGLDPSNTSAFATGLTFESDGTFTGTQTPITEGAAVPEPSTWAMMLLGFVGLGFVGYRKAQQRAGS